jgi:SAM-dependent methyltransferase
MSELHQQPSPERIWFLPQQEISLEPFDASGYILDIGGGGEGIIGLLQGSQVIAIDPHERELAATPPGPLKIVMDARDLKFLDNSFDAATSFFTLMYVRSPADQERILSQVFRVLEPGGQFRIWDVAIPDRLPEGKDIFVVRLLVRVGAEEIETGYGAVWPGEGRGMDHYVEMAERVGFRVCEQQELGYTFFIRLCKP